MRTTLNIPQKLIEDVRKQLGFSSKTDTIIFALKELQRKKGLRRLVESFGTFEFDMDVDKLRKRKAAKRT